MDELDDLVIDARKPNSALSKIDALRPDAEPGGTSMDSSAINTTIIGMTDLFGLGLRRRKYVGTQLAELARRHGYEPIEVPLVEKATSFSEEVVGRSPWPEWDQRGCFYLSVLDYSNRYNDVPSSTEALLIPEGTISVTRWLGQQLADDPALVFPVKLIYETPCFRNEVISGIDDLKRRQFTQFGLEVLGAGRVSDIEVIHLIAESLRHLRVPGEAIRVRVGDVDVFNRLVELSALDADTAIEVKEVLDSVAECKAGKRPERRAGLVSTLTDLLDRTAVDERWAKVWLDLAREPKSLTTVEAVEDQPIAARLADLRALAEVLGELDVTVEIDLCVVRSHEYYTGVAFEIDVATPDEVFVEVGGGGRYDRLVKHFAPDSNIAAVPATGFAFGLERLVHLLDRLGLLGSDTSATQRVELRSGSADILVVTSATPSGYLSGVQAAAMERAAGRAVDVYLGDAAGGRDYAAARTIDQIRQLPPVEDRE